MISYTRNTLLCSLSYRFVNKEFYGGYSSGVHLFPFRTEKLSPPAPMILQLCGKVGCRQNLIRRTFYPHAT